MHHTSHTDPACRGHIINTALRSSRTPPPPRVPCFARALTSTPTRSEPGFFPVLSRQLGPQLEPQLRVVSARGGIRWRGAGRPACSAHSLAVVGRPGGASPDWAT